jgi:urease accessory protein
MLEVRARHAGGGSGESRDRLHLPFDLRQKSRLRAKLESGEDIAIALPRGQVLRGGDLLRADDGRVIEVVAESERVMNAECASAESLARIAYHLGNRHVAVQLVSGAVRFAADAVLCKMVEGLGARVTELDVPFEPEAGAYAPHHRHDESGHGGRIHEFHK